MAIPTFRELLFQPTDRWTAEKLEQLTITELKTLCKICGIVSNKNYKQLYIDHLIKQTQIQRLIRPYWGTLDEQPTTEQIQRLADRFQWRTLRDLCRAVGTYAPGSKYGMAAALISWSRSSCRIGQRFYQEQLAIARANHQAKQYKQLSLL